MSSDELLLQTGKPDIIAATLLPVLFIFVFGTAYAEDECIFDKTAYVEFINKYTIENGNSKIDPDGKTLIVKRDNEEITVKGGGCIHLGESIELKTRHEYTEAQFLQKTLDLAVEFGKWLINTSALKNSIEKGRYQKIDDTYFIEVDAMTVFSASYDNQSKINVDFYIN